METEEMEVVGELFALSGEGELFLEHGGDGF